MKVKRMGWLGLVLLVSAGTILLFGPSARAAMDNQIIFTEHDGPITGGGFNADDMLTFHKYVGGLFSDIGIIPNFAPGGWQVSGAAVGDVNNDGKNEVAVCYQYSDGTGAIMDGFINIFDYTNGAWTSLWGYHFNSGGWAHYGVGIGNVDNSLDGSNELVIGWHYGNRTNVENDLVIVYCFNGSSLTELCRSPQWDGGWNIGGIGVGDLNGDGQTEVVIGWSFYRLDTGTNDGNVLHVVDFTNNVFSSILWNIPVGSPDPADHWDICGMGMGDANNDGVKELAMAWRQYHPDAGTGRLPGTEEGKRVSLYTYTGAWGAGTLTGPSVMYEDATSNIGIYGIGIGNADNGTLDLPTLLAALDSIPGDGNWNHHADLDGDAVVTSSDLATYLSNM